MENAMADEYESLLRRKVRSPRAAAIAGIIYSILMGIIMISTYSAAKVKPENVTGEWLQDLSATASVDVILIPYVGIAFLWFTGVVRDRLRHHQGSFFATLFLGSGIILVSLWFFWGTIFGAIMVTKDIIAVGSAGSGIYIFGFVLMDEIMGNYALRIAGLYMTAIATLWTRTGLMTYWLTIVTYILALGFLVAAERIREARFIFPIWVLVVSSYILIPNYRRTHDLETEVI
jgi:hypothetical protein